MKLTPPPLLHATPARPLLRLLAFFGILMVLAVGMTACNSMSVSKVPIRTDDSSVRIASFNIHYIAPKQKKLSWDRRKDAVVEAIRDIDADIIGFQEMETWAGGSFNTENRQHDWIIKHFPEYTAGAYGNADVYPITQPIFFRSDRFRQIDQGFFFFSETPDVIYSHTFNGSWPAFCSWTVLEEKATGKRLSVYNVHFEYKSMGNRAKASKLVADRISPVVARGEAVVLLGDTNAFSYTPTMRTLKAIPLTLAPSAGPTFHFNRGIELLPAIDHIMYSAALEQQGETTRLRERYNDIWPTDHYPIVVDLLSVESP